MDIQQAVLVAHRLLRQQEPGLPLPVLLPMSRCSRHSTKCPRLSSLFPSGPPSKASQSTREGLHSSLFNRVGEFNRAPRRRLLSTRLAKNKVDISVPIWLPVLCVCPLLVRILRDRRVGLRTQSVNAIPFLSISRDQQSWPRFSLM